MQLYRRDLASGGSPGSAARQDGRSAHEVIREHRPAAQEHRRPVVLIVKAEQKRLSV